MRRRISVLMAVALAAVAGADTPSPILEPYPGSTRDGTPILRDFDEVDLPVGPSQDTKKMEVKRLTGRLSVRAYVSPANRSVLEVSTNYEEALRKAGFDVVFACRGKECPRLSVPYLGLIPDFVRNEPSRYVVAKRARPEGDVWAAVHQLNQRTRIVTLETKAMETGKVQVTAEALGSDLSRQGHVAVYEILFDSDKADIKPASKPALDEIAKLLRQNASMKLWVVGHTDAQGALAHNMDLSKRRAEAVARALTDSYGIAASRLGSGGVGPLAPVATNRTEEGRAKNRRVELVDQ